MLNTLELELDSCTTHHISLVILFANRTQGGFNHGQGIRIQGRKIQRQCGQGE